MANPTPDTWPWRSPEFGGTIFLNEQHGAFSGKIISEKHGFISRHEDASLAGLKWFPRIIEKARGQTYEGELPL